MQFYDHFETILDDLRILGRYRGLTPLAHVGGRVDSPSGPILNFSSNDYLNLANDPRLKRAAQDAIERYGAGATASRLMAGDLELHETLERELAALVDQPAALVFSTGYSMNVGVLAGLFDASWTIFSDSLNHASIVDGCRLSRANVRVFPHNDVKALAQRLASTQGLCAIVTESIFSMDGDCAPLTEYAALAREYGAMLIVDEAHAVGVYGDGGGVCRALGIRPDVTLGTLGKSLGSAGGFAATSELLRDVLINRARPFIFSTGLAPACAGAALEAVRIVRETHELGHTLLKNAYELRKQLHEIGIITSRSDMNSPPSKGDLGGCSMPREASPIIPIIIGDDREAVALSQALETQRILAKAVRPPTVPTGTSRLRISLTLAHTPEDLTALAAALQSALTPS